MNIGNKAGRFLTGLIVGSLAGAAVGVMIAPRPGKQMRHQISHKTREHVGNLRAKFKKSADTHGAPEHVDAHHSVEAGS